MKKTLSVILLILLSMACTLTNALPRPGHASEPTPLTTSPTPHPTETSTAPANSCTVNAEHLNLRSGPGLTWGSIAILNNGETVTILSEPAQGSSWVHVDAGGREGWINQNFCEGDNP